MGMSLLESLDRDLLPSCTACGQTSRHLHAPKTMVDTFSSLLKGTSPKTSSSKHPLVYKILLVVIKVGQVGGE